MANSVDLNIYLARPGVDLPQQLVNDVDSLRANKIEIKGLAWCVLYTKKPLHKPPRWATLFASDVPQGVFGQNSFTGAVLCAKADKQIFALTFGIGHTFLDSSAIEVGFGLKTALGLVDKKSLRSIDKSSFEQHPKQIREQRGLATELHQFGIDIERDLLRAVTGAPSDREFFGPRISGLDSLRISVELKLRQLPALLRRLGKEYSKGAYKRNEYAWIDHLGEVKSKVTQDQLDVKLLQLISNGTFDRLWLSTSEIIDWDRVVGFRYALTPNSPRHYDLHMQQFVKTLTSKDITVAKLKSRKIHCVDSDDNPVLSRPAYRFIYAEIEDQGCVYVLNNGKWYKVSRKFSDQVARRFRQIKNYTRSLPEYNDASETAYNERVARRRSRSFCLLDRRIIVLANGTDQIEACDLLRNGAKGVISEFIHVKRFGGSSVLSHLFNQGLVSADLFHNDREFRERLNSILPKRLKLAKTDETPQASKFKIVFAIISESPEKRPTIPFFSRISLCHVVERLKAIGFKVEIANIRVNKLKANTLRLPRRQ